MATCPHKFWWDFDRKRGEKPTTVKVFIHNNETGQTSELCRFVAKGTEYTAFQAMRDADKLIADIAAGRVSLDHVRERVKELRQANGKEV